MTTDPLMGILDAVTEEMRCETGDPPSGWMVAKRIAAKLKETTARCKEWETKYHELLHRTRGTGQ